MYDDHAKTTDDFTTKCKQKKKIEVVAKNAA